ncbi:MarR family winged helix-turn-helix transcriptional regulator [Sphaerisporangium fuscum]|uniref:MarR family winged helix-turn-helix transcriptional regulator n=1 Tax=Sphaerisporangium fuscum TaxID=2835868 RepID=UPI001BDC614B|nr:MarR family winged helix-turn-helix transcriptional regulator [Sphaerisporangium fuscum]
MGRRPEQPIGLLFDVLAVEERVGQLLRLALAETGLKPMEYAVTSLLATLGPTTPSQMAKGIGMRPSTLSGHLAALTRRGVIQRERAPVDGRSALLELTEEGQRLQRDAVAQVKRHMVRLQTELSNPVEQVRGVLNDLANALDRTVEAAG